MPEELRLIPRSTRAPSPTLRDLLAVMFRQRKLALISFAAVLLATLVYRLVAPIYQAEMTVLVRHGRVDPVMTATPTEPQFQPEEVTEEELNSEVELLHDQEILRTVAKASGLAAEKESWFRKLLGESEDERLARSVRRLGRRLNVEPVRKTTLIAVTYESSDPAQAATVLQCLAGAYLERHSRLHRPSGESDFFQQQIAQSRRSLEQAELQLMEFTRDEGVVSAAQERDIAVQRAGEAEANIRENRVAIAETGERVRMLQLKMQSLPERATTTIRNTDNPQLLGKIKSRLLELELQRTELLTKFAPSYRLVQEVDQQIAETKNSIASEELAPLREQSSDLDSNHAWAKGELVKAEVELSALHARAGASGARLASVQEEAQVLGDRAVKQDELVSSMKAAEAEYLLYVNKREEARIGDALDQERILNIIIAEQPTAPSLPAKSGLTFGMLGFMCAGMFSTGLAFTADRLNPAFRTPDEVVAYLGAPVLASLPRRGG
jgi:uncharacterized protein involved in exopolysaccharide biosynthesis